MNANLSPVCGQTLTVTYEGKSVEVTVVDKLPSHPAGDLDLSTAAFASIAVSGKTFNIPRILALTDLSEIMFVSYRF